MNKRGYILLLLNVAFFTVFAQKGIVSGNIYNSLNNEPLPFAAIAIQGTSLGATSDRDGNYEMTR